MKSHTLLFIGLALAFVGCGRSDLLGDNTTGCPQGFVRDINGNCIPIGTLPDFSTGHADGGHPGMDGGRDGSIPCKDKQEICDNGIDDNCNGLTDCQDPECASDPHCVQPGQEICNNG